MRKVAKLIACLAAMLMTLGACADSPMGPEQQPRAADLATVEAPQAQQLAGCVRDGVCMLPPVTISPVCDPWMSLDWCEGDGGTCMTSVPYSYEYQGVLECPGTGGGGGGPTPPKLPGGGTPICPTAATGTCPEEPEDCNPNTNPDCLLPLSAWDKETLRQAFARHLRTSFTDLNAAQMCNQLTTQFNQMMVDGRVFRGAFGSTGEPNDPLHVAAYDQVGGTIHFEPEAMASANAGNATAVRNLINSALHEAAHSLNFNHTPPVWMGSYDLYAEPPFNLLSPGANSCITNW